MKKVFLLILSLSAMMVSAQDYAGYVNLFIGTGGHGHTSPAAVVPHGMIQPGPDTRHHGWDACSGYYYEDRTMNGFSQTRLTGTGCADLADFLLMPTNTFPNLKHQGEKGNRYECPWASPFSHATEKAEPGYYSVRLPRYNVSTEITATERAALYRFKYNASAQENSGNEQYLLLDLDYNNQNQYVLDMQWQQTSPTTLQAFRRTLGWAYNQPIYLQAEFSQPFDVVEVRDTVIENNRAYPCCKLVLRFKANEGALLPSTVMAKVAISAVDYEGAKKNLLAEMPGWNFEQVRHDAREKWNKALGRIEIKALGAAAADSTRRIFYTGLYHSLLVPQLFCDVDGRYLGSDLKIYSTDPQKDPMYTVFSLWDTHRALHPLISIIEPTKNEAYIRSLIKKGDQLGVVPKWELDGNDTGCMIGYHYVSLLADAYTKGYTDFDLTSAYRHALHTAQYDTTGISATLPKWKYGEIMPEAIFWKETTDFIPCDKTGESVAKGLEYAYDDWCVAQVAKGMGDTKNAEKFSRQAQFYRLYFDPETGFMRGKTEKGTWRTPFDPTSSDHRMDDYTEGNAWQWSFFAPHDPQGLINLFGGEKKFTKKLDALFAAPSEMTGDNVSPDIDGFIGQYAHGNEPSHATIFLYNYTRKPWRTQELVDSVLTTLYADAPDGLSGNEDCGQMSAWYILNAMGFYQMCPGKPEYTISRPLFKEVAIHLPDGKTFTIKTVNNSPKNKFIKSIRLNGKKLKSPFFTHKDITAGGEMVIEMKSKP